MAIKHNKMVWEVIDECSNLKQRVDKIDYLMQNKSDALMSVLRGAYDLSLVFDFGEDGVMPGSDFYEPADESSHPSNLAVKHIMLLKFLAKPKNNQYIKDKLPKQRVFRELLESVHPRDAELLLKMIEKKPLGKGITTKVVMEAFPNLITDPKLNTQEKRKWLAEKEAEKAASEEFRATR